MRLRTKGLRDAAGIALALCTAVADAGGPPAPMTDTGTCAAPMPAATKALILRCPQLANLDVGGDGRLSPDDPAWGELYVASDTDGDRRFAPDEIRPLAAEGITALDAVTCRQFIREEGSTGAMEVMGGVVAPYGETALWQQGHLLLDLAGDGIDTRIPGEGCRYLWTQSGTDDGFLIRP